MLVCIGGHLLRKWQWRRMEIAQVAMEARATVMPRMVEEVLATLAWEVAVLSQLEYEQEAEVVYLALHPTWERYRRQPDSEYLRDLKEEREGDACGVADGPGRRKEGRKPEMPDGSRLSRTGTKVSLRRALLGIEASQRASVRQSILEELGDEERAMPTPSALPRPSEMTRQPSRRRSSSCRASATLGADDGGMEQSMRGSEGLVAPLDDATGQLMCEGPAVAAVASVPTAGSDSNRGTERSAVADDPMGDDSKLARSSTQRRSVRRALLGIEASQRASVRQSILEELGDEERAMPTPSALPRPSEMTRQPSRRRSSVRRSLGNSSAERRASAVGNETSRAEQFSSSAAVLRPSSTAEGLGSEASTDGNGGPGGAGWPATVAHVQAAAQDSGQPPECTVKERPGRETRRSSSSRSSTSSRGAGLVDRLSRLEADLPGMEATGASEDELRQARETIGKLQSAVRQAQLPLPGRLPAPSDRIGAVAMQRIHERRRLSRAELAATPPVAPPRPSVLPPPRPAAERCKAALERSGRHNNPAQGRWRTAAIGALSTTSDGRHSAPALMLPSPVPQPAAAEAYATPSPNSSPRRALARLTDERGPARQGDGVRV